MQSETARPTLSEKGLLTPDNCIVTMIDLQPHMLFAVANFDRQHIIHMNVAFGKPAKIFAIPVILSTIETNGFSGNMWPQAQAAFPQPSPIVRSAMNAWDDKNFVSEAEKTGRRKIVLDGLSTETCVAHPTVQPIYDSSDIYVVADCCGDVSQLAHDNAMTRILQAGAKPVTALSVMLEWQRDWGARGPYDAVMDVVKPHYGAHAMGVDYACTMVHGAPATQFQTYLPLSAPAH